jgi:hypothetical protein
MLVFLKARSLRSLTWVHEWFLPIPNSGGGDVPLAARRSSAAVKFCTERSEVHF